LESIETVLPLAVSLLKSGGRLAVISFHSLEDRLVKEYFRRESRDCICPPRQPICTCGHKAILKEINRKPIEADEEEIKTNSRARSAKLRVAEKI
jgi:16S rRNA (cytosine1402-N4)-methyltransferase